MNIELHIITENQTTQAKAEKIGQLIKQKLNLPIFELSISRYEKFENSYSIKGLTEIDKSKSDDELMMLLLKMTSNICRPWTINFPGPIFSTELYFNKQSDSSFSSQNFNVIKWAHIYFLNNI